MNKLYNNHVDDFRALSDINRHFIVNMLVSAEAPGEMCATAIKKNMKISQPTLSYHMKILCGCGLVSKRKDGKWVYYSLHHDGVKKMRDFFNSGSPHRP
jgi:ArsR family transcriptional regulator